MLTEQFTCTCEAIGAGGIGIRGVVAGHAMVKQWTEDLHVWCSAKQVITVGKYRHTM